MWKLKGATDGLGCHGIILEQLEERIVLDGAVDDASCRIDLLSSPVAVQALGEASASVSSLALESGTEILPDGTWHHWERDEWATDNNGYEFHAWQDGSFSFHQVQWDSASNSKGTHNGFEYDLLRDGSWTYQTIQWDAGQNGYRYDATSAGVYDYYAQQWANWLGYDYSSDSDGHWTYRTTSTGNDAGDRGYYLADSTGWYDYTYAWANGTLWHDTNCMVCGWHAVNDTWSYTYVGASDTGYWTEDVDGGARFGYHYDTGQWFSQGPAGGWAELGAGFLSPDFVGDGKAHTFPEGWSFCYSGGVGTWNNTALDLEQFKYDYEAGQWYDQGKGDGWEPRGSNGLSAAFIGDGNPHTMDGKWSYALIGGVGYWTDTVNQVEYKYDYSSGDWDWLNANANGWEDYQNTSLKAAYFDMTGSLNGGEPLAYFPPAGIQELDAIVVGFVCKDERGAFDLLGETTAQTKYLQIMEKIISKTFSGAKGPEIYFSIGGATVEQGEIDAHGGGEQVANNVIQQVEAYNKGLAKFGLQGRIVGIDIDLEKSITADTINLMAKTIHDKGLKVSIAPQAFAYAVEQPDKTWKAYVKSEDPKNLVLTSGPEANTYGKAIQNGYVDQIMVQAYNQGQYGQPPYFKVDGYGETQLESFKSTSRALNVWVSGATYFPIPETTKIFMGSVANQIAGGYTIFNPEAKQTPYAYDDQKILNQLKADILTMQNDPVNYGRISGVFFWALANDYSPKSWQDIWAVAGGFSTTIFGATPVPEPAYAQHPESKNWYYTDNYLKYW